MTERERKLLVDKARSLLPKYGGPDGAVEGAGALMALNQASLLLGIAVEPLDELVAEVRGGTCAVTYEVTVFVPDSAPTDGDVGELTHEVREALARKPIGVTALAQSKVDVKLVNVERVA